MSDKLSDELLAELRSLATSTNAEGPWTAETWDVIRNRRKTGYREGIVRDPDGVSITCDDGVYGVLVAADAEYMAAFDPPTVLALLDEVEQVRAELRDVFKTDIPSLRGRADLAEAKLDGIRNLVSLVRPDGEPVTYVNAAVLRAILEGAS